MNMRVVLVFYCLIAPVVLAEESIDASRLSGESMRGPVTLEGALKGKRLFFAEHERQSSDNPMLVSDEKLLDEQSPDKVQAHRVPDMSVPDMGVARPVKSQRHESMTNLLRYDARITSSKLIRIVMNGAPCERLDIAADSLGSSGREFTCASVDPHELQLVLMPDRISVKAMRGSVELGVLKPGRKL